MSIALVVTRGFSNGTLVGTIKDVVTTGYTIAEPPEGGATGAQQISIAISIKL